MNKLDLVNVIAAETGLKKKDAELALNATLTAIEGALKDGDKVSLIGFGNFEVKSVAAHVGRNPQTNEEIKIPASKKPVFTASKVLKDTVNG